MGIVYERSGEGVLIGRERKSSHRENGGILTPLSKRSWRKGRTRMLGDHSMTVKSNFGPLLGTPACLPLLLLTVVVAAPSPSLSLSVIGGNSSQSLRAGLINPGSSPSSCVPKRGPSTPTEAARCRRSPGRMEEEVDPVEAERGRP